MQKRNTQIVRISKRGFTLLELLIVIAIISVLAVILILVLNPTEILKKSRDSQRLSDLGTLKTALGIYVTSSSTPDLDAAVATDCLTDTSGVANTNAKVNYSTTQTLSACIADIIEGGNQYTGATFSTTKFCRSVTSGEALVDGTGWLPVNLTALTGGSPISNLPIDPINTVTNTPSTPASGDLVYRYVCQNKAGSGKPSYVFEINAQLESDAFTSEDDKRIRDGGDNTNYYEVGTNLRLLGTGTNF